MRCGFGHSGRDAQLELQGYVQYMHQPLRLGHVHSRNPRSIAEIQGCRSRRRAAVDKYTHTPHFLSFHNYRRSHMWLQSRGRVPFDPFTIQTRSFSLILTRTDVCCLQVTRQPWLISDVSTIAVAFPRSIVKFSLFSRRTSISRALLK